MYNLQTDFWPSITKGQMLLVLQNLKDFCNMYPYVSGEFKPVERRKNASSYDESGRVEAGMKLKSL